MKSIDQQLEQLRPLPTEFFPSPEPGLPSSPTAEANSSSVPPPEHHHRHRDKRVIAIAYDQSNYADAMISKAIRLSLIRPTDDIRLVHIIDQSDYRNLFTPLLSGSKTSTRGYDDEPNPTLDSVSSAMIWEVVNALRKLGFKHVSSEVLRGDPKQSITDYCRMVKPVYLLSGTRGFGAIKRTVMGSVSNFLTHHCPCPVLVIKLDPQEIEARKELNEKKQTNFAEVYDVFSASHPQK
ncbi:uncharacterized protein B0P05DRAFT_527996 [Gilbertella persicaria]|uniref:UspA domain-containing protein n=1 Tax=Rhizopus stolonifer TaxID=4846 RepID=A0A367KQU2_RHIST|nr:uncharacterized protein B0P05DRAFT_527996 [Gilbertella persicaria]KAI8090926.1 hypothetical protein B0P05DRAFT_527996 [Gilbertella persicaria]RCI04559.1 hypothetical protein CU098_009260 [Rhizopus stolonifer]